MQILLCSKKINTGLKTKINHTSTCTLLCGNGQKNEKINRANLAKYALDHIYRQTSECGD